ncbi:MAG TPA: hypothetical protein VHE78_03150 [Gemmatimonadaceae bacterium]|nr:hypothetical protein [Gemmatimonadaceae bacterium]
MTIAATLSRKLYETFGDEAAGAMVDWMERMDTQRTELRELNDLSFARIDARFGEADARLGARFKEVDARFKEADARIDARFKAADARIDARFKEVDARFKEADTKIDARFAAVNARIDLLGAELTGRIDALKAEFGEKLATRFSDLLKWSFVFWATTIVTLFLRTK